MANHKPLTPEDHATIREMLANGIGIKHIAKAVSRAEKTVRVWATTEGLRPPGGNPVEWPEAWTLTAKRLYDAGHSYSQIAAEIGNGLTRAAVSGKVFRLGWTRAIPSIGERITGGMAQRNRAPKRPRQAKPRKQRQHNNFAAFNTQRRAQSPKREVPVLPMIVDATHAKHWTQRAFGECAYPILGEGADVLSCCHRTGGKTYCPAHRAIMFRKPDPIDVVRANAQRRAAMMRGGKERVA